MKSKMKYQPLLCVCVRFYTFMCARHFSGAPEYLGALLGAWALSTAAVVRREPHKRSYIHPHNDTHTHIHIRTPPNTLSHTLRNPTGARCLCCVINQSCQIDFTAPSEKRRGSHPTTLKKMEESKSRRVLWLLNLIPGLERIFKQWRNSFFFFFECTWLTSLVVLIMCNILS